MFLSKHANGRYYAYFDIDGKRFCRSTGSKYKSFALKFLVSLKEEIEKKKAQKFIPIKLYDFRFHFFRYAESIFTSKTLTGYKVTFNHLLRYFGNVYLAELTKQQIENYLYSRIRETSIFAGIKDYAHLSSLLNKAIQDGFLIENPLKGIRRMKAPQKLPLFYSKDEFRKLLSTIDNEDIRDLAIVAVNTGMRQMELLTLGWNQINFEEKYIILDNRGHITKGKKVRTIPANENSLEILKRRFLQKKDLNGSVFTYNGFPIKQDFIIHKFKKYVRRSGVNPRLNFHSLRHTFASWLVQSGTSIYIVSKLLGHADIKTTEIYSHLRREDLKEATTKIEY